MLLVGVSPNSLGEFMAKAIANHAPALLILASRTESRINEVINSIRPQAPEVPIKTVVVELSSQKSVRQAAKEINALTSKLDIVINNAAVNVQDYQTTEEGIEMHFGTNHVGLFLLTNLVLGKVIEAAETSSTKGSTRIINLTSAGHRLSPIRFSDYNFQKKRSELPEEEQPAKWQPMKFVGLEVPYEPYIAYGQSKTANILFSVSLTGKLKERGVLSFSVHPGCERALLLRNAMKILG